MSATRGGRKPRSTATRRSSPIRASTTTPTGYPTRSEAPRSASRSRRASAAYTISPPKTGSCSPHSTGSTCSAVSPDLEIQREGEVQQETGELHLEHGFPSGSIYIGDRGVLRHRRPADVHLAENSDSNSVLGLPFCAAPKKDGRQGCGLFFGNCGAVGIPEIAV